MADVATGAIRESTTSAEGLYRVLSLGPGTYSIVVEKTGFLTAQQDNVTVGINETVRADINLRVGAVSERVTVAAAPPRETPDC